MILGAGRPGFVDLKLKKDERIKWLDAWGSIDTDTSNSVDAAEFFAAFKSRPNPIARKLYIYDAKKNNSVPFHDFLITSWRLCHVVARSLRRSQFSVVATCHLGFNKLDSTLDVRDVQRFVEHRYGFKKASAKKSRCRFSVHRSLACVEIKFRDAIDANRSISAQTRTGPGAWTSRSSRLLDGRTPSSWPSAIACRPNYDIGCLDGSTGLIKQKNGKTGIILIKSSKVTWRSMLDQDTATCHRSSGSRARPSVSASSTPAPKKKEAAVDFWGEFPEVYQQVLTQIKREEGEKATLAALHRTMRAELHGKLIKAVETLFGDARSLEGCFSRWKARCVQQRRLLRDVDSATGTETTELDVDDAVHAGIIETMNRTLPSHEVRDATLLKAHDIATQKRSKRSVGPRPSTGRCAGRSATIRSSRTASAGASGSRLCRSSGPRP